MIFRFSAVEKDFRLGDEKWHFGPVSAAFSRGEFVAIVGASGSGKSTFLHLAGGFLAPDAGEIVFENQKFSDFSARDFERFRNQNIGFVFQEFFLFPDFSLVENVAMPLLVAGFSRKKAFEKAHDALEKVDLFSKKNHFPAELSGGQRQRGAIARAIVRRPKILFADEPTGNLDGKTGQKIIALLQKIHRDENATVVLVTHDAALAALADRTLKMADGRLVSR